MPGPADYLDGQSPRPFAPNGYALPDAADLGTAVPVCPRCGRPQVAGAVYCAFCNSAVQATPIGAQGVDGAVGVPGRLGPVGPVGIHTGIHLVGGAQAPYAVAPFAGQYAAVPAGESGDQFGEHDLRGLSESLAGFYPARVGKRFVSALVDAVILAILLAIVEVPLVAMVVNRELSPSLVGILAVAGVALAVYVLMIWRWQARAGLSIGKRLLGLRLVAADSGAAPGWGPVAGRVLLLGVFAIPTLGIATTLSTLSCLWDKSRFRRSWHDKLSGLVLITSDRLPAEHEAKSVPDQTLGDGFTEPGVQYQSPGPHRAPDYASPTWATPVTASGSTSRSDSPIILRFEDDAWAEVVGLTLVGRNPSPASGEDVSWIVPWADESHSMSKTHIGVTLENGQLMVSDRNSTNGTRVVRPDGTEIPVAPDQRVGAPIGSVIWCGDRRITVCEAGQ